MNIELVNYSKIFLELSWDWLSDPEIRVLTNTPIFTKNEQRIWFDSLNNRKDYIIWGIQVDNTPIGACRLKKITDKDCEFWCYIGEKKFWGKGIGTKVLEILINLAKNKNLSSIWLVVLKNNIRAIHLYEKFGFKKENESMDGLIKMKLNL